METLRRFITKNPITNYTGWRIDYFIRSMASLLVPSQRVLDIGAGKQPYRKYFIRHRYIPLDLGVALTYPETMKQEIICDISTTAPELPPVDVIILTQVLEHIRDTDALFANMSKLLIQDGGVWMTFPMISREHQVPYDFVRLTRWGLNYYAKKHGFRVEYIRPMGGFGTMLASFIQNIYLLPFTPHVVSTIKREKAKNFIPLARALWWPVSFFFGILGHLLDLCDKERGCTLGYEAVLRKIGK